MSQISPQYVDGLELRIRELEADVERLKAGGCARDQRTTQYCAEAVTLQNKLRELEADVGRLQTLAEKLEFERGMWKRTAEAVEAKLRAVEGLLKKWHRGHHAYADSCASQLEAALKEQKP